jgi:hypothetical protein
MGPVKLVVSLLPSAFRLLSMGMRTKNQPMRHHALLPQKFRWHRYGKPKCGLIRARYNLLFKLSCPSHECALSLRYFDFHVVDAGSEHTYTNASFTTACLLYIISCEDVPVGR